MPYKLRKAPNRDLYWVVTIETGKKHSKDPIPIEKAKGQMRILESVIEGGSIRAIKAVRRQRYEAEEIARQNRHWAQDLEEDRIQARENIHTQPLPTVRTAIRKRRSKLETIPEIEGNGKYTDKLNSGIDSTLAHFYPDVAVKYYGYFNSIRNKAKKELQAVGPTFGNEERRKKKERIVNNAINDATIFANSRGRRGSGKYDDVKKDLADITREQEVDYATKPKQKKARLEQRVTSGTQLLDAKHEFTLKQSDTHTGLLNPDGTVYKIDIKKSPLYPNIRLMSYVLTERNGRPTPDEIGHRVILNIISPGKFEYYNSTGEQYGDLPKSVRYVAEKYGTPMNDSNEPHQGDAPICQRHSLNRACFNGTNKEYNAMITREATKEGLTFDEYIWDKTQLEVYKLKAKPKGSGRCNCCN